MELNRKIRKACLPACWLLGAVLMACGGKNETGTLLEMATVKRGDIRHTITATGTVEPINQVEVGTQVSGTIARLHVDFNSEVRAGQLLAELDKTLMETTYESQVAMLRSNENELNYQQKNYERSRGLHEKRLISDVDFETAEYQYFKALRAVEKSRSDVANAKRNLDYCRIYSPVNGVVLSREVDEGQTVAAMFSTPVLFKIAEDLRRMRVVASVDEADIGKLKEGQKVWFSVDAFPDERFDGAVSQIRLQPIVTSNVVTYEVVIDAPNPDLKLKPGLTANITVLTDSREGVLTVPLRALRFRPVDGEGNVSSEEYPGKGVWVETDEGLKRIEVKTGISDGIVVEVLNGVKEGDRVATGIVIPEEKGGKKAGAKPGSNPLMPNMTGQRSH